MNQFAAVLWGVGEAWQWPRGSEIDIAAPGRADLAGAMRDAEHLDRVVRAPRDLPVRAYVVEVDDGGRLVDGPIALGIRQANPRARVYAIRRTGDRVEIERADRWTSATPAEWQELPLPLTAPAATVDPGCAAAGPTSIRAGQTSKAPRLVSCRVAGSLVPESEHRCHDPRCYDRLAELQATMIAANAGPRRPYPHLTAAERRRELAALRSAVPHAEPWVTACLSS